MRYKIRQKIFSLGDRFTIKDMNDHDKFIVQGKVISLGKKLKILDLDGNELVYIEQELLNFLPKYKIHMNEELVAIVKKELSFFRPRFLIESKTGTYKMDGDLFSHDFSVMKDGVAVATVSKEWLTLSDTYGVDIAESENQAFLLALVIVIDQVLHDGNK